MPIRTWSAGSIDKISRENQDNLEKLERLIKIEEDFVQINLGRGGTAPVCAKCSGRYFFEEIHGEMRLYCLNGHEIKVISRNENYVKVSKLRLRGL